MRGEVTGWNNGAGPIPEIGRIESLQEVSPGIWNLVVEAPNIARLLHPGQFLHVRVSEGWLPFLRRPLSAGPTTPPFIRFIFNIRGRGTKVLAEKRAGENLDLIGPLGNPFPGSIMVSSPTGASGNSILTILVAGGIGVVPLLFLQDRIPREGSHFFLGVRTKSALPILLQEAEDRGLILASDDGSVGFRGTVIDVVESFLKDKWGIGVGLSPSESAPQVVIYGCGPVGMMRALKELAVRIKAPCYLSVEVPMGCGLGACQSCAVPRADGEGYRLVCRDGPVFECREIKIEEGVLP